MTAEYSLPAWLKTTPCFAAHEAGVIGMIARVDPGLVPGVVAADPERRRVLLDHVSESFSHGE